jgi:hypothetical protein
LILAAGAQSAGAQSAMIRGVVSDPAGSPIQDASVEVTSVAAAAGTDQDGRFTVRNLEPLAGEIEILVRRIGYLPAKLRVGASALVDWIRVTLDPTPAQLAPVEVSRPAMKLRAGFAEFRQRRERGLGKYVTREEILARRASLTTDVLRTIPGVRVVGGRGLGGVRFQSSTNVRGDCMPLIWLDGQAVPDMELNEIPLGDIEGIELYNGPSTVPMEFAPPSWTESCGAVVVWTRVPGTR